MDRNYKWLSVKESKQEVTNVVYLVQHGEKLQMVSSTLEIRTGPNDRIAHSS